VADNPDARFDPLWNDFHRVVNMTSQELSEWLKTQSAHENSEELPENAITGTGRQVLAILQKHRTDVIRDDVRVMRRVVRLVNEKRREEDLTPTAGNAPWRHRLMSVGHDPLKPV
jgi:uncharacterized protein DUF3140